MKPVGRLPGSILIICIIALLNTSCVEDSTMVVSPAEDASVYGQSVKLIVKSFKKPDFDIFLDENKCSASWEKEAWLFRWIAKISIPQKGIHELDLRKNDELIKSIRFNNTLSIPEIAQDLISRYSLENPPERLKWDWAPAVLLYALMKYAPYSIDEAASIEYVKKYHLYWLDKGIPEINWADECPSALSALILYRDYGMETALPAIDKAVSYIKTAPRNELGSIDHLGTSAFSLVYPDSIWVDSLMMWALLSVQYGVYSNDRELADFGIRQQQIFSSKLLDEKTGLYHHAFNIEKATLVPEDNAFWLRGNAWVLVCQIEMIEAIGENHEKYNELCSMFKSLAHNTLKHRQPSGYWDTVIAEPGYAYEESSGSALIAYAYAKGVRMGLLDVAFMMAARDTFSSITARMTRNDNGLAVADTSSGTIPSNRIGYRLVKTSNNIPYGAGAWLMLASEMIQKPGRGAKNLMSGTLCWIHSASCTKISAGGVADPVN